MARAIWTGSISFGLVNVPVKLYSAQKQQDVHFHQLEEGTGARVRNKRVSEKTGREVPYEKIVKGYEFGKGKYVTVTQDELEDIDPIFYERTYYLAPAGGSGSSGATKAYALLLKSMQDKGKVGIGRVVLRTKQYLAAVRPLEKGILGLSTMLFADEIVPTSEIDSLPDRIPSVGDREKKMAEQLIESLSGEWKPAKYKDTYREQLLDLIEQKAEGKEIVVEETGEKKAPVVDLMAALEASLEAAKKGTTSKGRAATAKKPATRPAKKKRSARTSSAPARKSA